MQCNAISLKLDFILKPKLVIQGSSSPHEPLQDGRASGFDTTRGGYAPSNAYLTENY